MLLAMPMTPEELTKLIAYASEQIRKREVEINQRLNESGKSMVLETTKPQIRVERVGDKKRVWVVRKDEPDVEIFSY